MTLFRRILWLRLYIVLRQQLSNQARLPVVWSSGMTSRCGWRALRVPMINIRASLGSIPSTAIVAMYCPKLFFLFWHFARDLECGCGCGSSRTWSNTESSPCMSHQVLNFFVSASDLNTKTTLRKYQTCILLYPLFLQQWCMVTVRKM